MIGLSRQFRDKSSDYWSFDLTTNTINKTVNLSVFSAYKTWGGPVIGTKAVSAQNANIGIDWGDGSTETYQQSFENHTHTYGATGTYNVKVYMREPELSLMGFGFGGTTMENGNLDFTGYKALSKFGWGSGSYTVTLSNPNDYYLSPNDYRNSFDWYAGNASVTITNLTNKVLDISPYGSWNAIVEYGNASYNRIKFPPIDLDTPSPNSDNYFYCRPTSGLEAVGPSAGDLNNWDADFSNQRIGGQWHLRGTGITGATGNINQLILPSTAFASSGIYEINILQLGCTSIDLSQMPWYFTGNKSIRIYLCPKLQEITYSGVTASKFSTIYLQDNDLQGQVDLSNFYMNDGVSNIEIRINNNTGLTQLTCPITLNKPIKTLYTYGCSGLTAINGFENTNFDINSSSLLVYNCSLDVVEVNKFLVTVNAGCTGGFTGRSLNISGNTAPDGTSGGYDGTTAKSDLISKGWSVTTD